MLEFSFKNIIIFYVFLRHCHLLYAMINYVNAISSLFPIEIFLNQSAITKNFVDAHVCIIVTTFQSKIARS